MSPRRLRIAHVSPLPPVRSGIADYSADLLPSLRLHVDCKAYAPGEAAEAFASGPDAVLLQIGNDPIHLPSVEALRANRHRIPAVVVLHDYSLHHLFAAAYLDRGRVREYAAELERAQGERGRALGKKALAGQVVPVWDLAPWSYPMSGGVIQDASALIVHSRLVRGAVLRERPDVCAVEIPHLVAPAPVTSREAARRELSLPADRVVAATLGIVTPAKRIGKVVEALARLGKGERPYLVVGGAVEAGDGLLERVRELGLTADVRFTGYLPEADFWRVASAADFAINLRFPTVGETSGAVCRLAGAGLPVVVTDTGWFRELHGSFAARVPVGENEVEILARELRLLTIDPEVRQRRSTAARVWGYARRPERIAEAYARVLRAAASGDTALQPVGTLVSRALLDLGVGRAGGLAVSERGPDAELLAAVGLRTAGVLPVPLEAFREEEDGLPEGPLPS